MFYAHTLSFHYKGISYFLYLSLPFDFMHVFFLPVTEMYNSLALQHHMVKVGVAAGWGWGVGSGGVSADNYT